MFKRPHVVDTLVLLLYVGITAVMIWPAFSDLRGPYGLIGAVDVYMFMWGFWWMDYSLATLHTWPFHTAMLYHPFGTGLAFHGGMMPLITTLFSPITHTLGPEYSYNLDIIFSFIFSAFSMYLLVNYLVGDRRAAFLGGCVFAFSTFKSVQTIGHLHITNTEFFPFYALFFIRMLRESSPNPLAVLGEKVRMRWPLRHAAFAGLALAFVFLIDYYQTVYLIFFSICYLIYYWFSHARRELAPLRLVSEPTLHLPLTRLRIAVRSSLLPWLARFMVLGGVFVAVASPLLIAIYTDIKAGYYVKWGGEDIFYADAAAFFVPYTPLLSWIPGVARATIPIVHQGGIESLVYAGWVVLLLAAFATIRLTRRSSEFRFWLVFVFISFLFALGPVPHFLGYALPFPGPYALWENIPFLNNARIPSRFDLLVTFAAGVLVGYAVREVLTILPRCLPRLRPSLIAAIFLVIVTPLLLAEHYVLPATTAGEQLNEPRSVFAQIAAEPGDFAVLDLPLDGPLTPHFGMEHIMYEQTMHHKATLGGSISRPLPAFYQYYDSVEYLSLLSNQPQTVVHQRDIQAVLTNTRAMSFYRRDAANLVYYMNVRYLIARPTVLPRNSLAFIEQTLPVTRIYTATGKIPDEVIYRVDLDALKPLVETDTVHLGSKADDVFRLQGWYDSEVGAGLSYSWLGSTSGTLLTTVRQPADYTVTMNLLPLVVNNRPQTLNLYVNDEINPVAEFQMPVSQWQTHTINISHEHWRAGINTLRFQTGYAAPPGNGDPRNLSLAVGNITFTAQK